MLFIVYFFRLRDSLGLWGLGSGALVNQSVSLKMLKSRLSISLSVHALIARLTSQSLQELSVPLRTTITAGALSTLQFCLLFPQSRHAIKILRITLFLTRCLGYYYISQKLREYLPLVCDLNVQ